jgi:hypothetical protein
VAAAERQRGVERTAAVVAVSARAVAPARAAALARLPETAEPPMARWRSRLRKRRWDRRREWRSAKLRRTGCLRLRRIRRLCAPLPAARPRRRQRLPDDDRADVHASRSGGNPARHGGLRSRAQLASLQRSLCDPRPTARMQGPARPRAGWRCLLDAVRLRIALVCARRRCLWDLWHMGGRERGLRRAECLQP